jgi:hypothetical protein
MMKEIDDWLTPAELAVDLWGNYPEDMYEGNAAWLAVVFDKLKLGGIWGWMETDRVFKKVSDTHFVELE